MKDSVFRSRAVFVDANSLDRAGAPARALLHELSGAYSVVAVGPGPARQRAGHGICRVEEPDVPAFARGCGIELYASWFVGDAPDAGFRGVLPAGPQTRRSLAAIRAFEEGSPVIVDPARLDRLAERLRRAGKRIVFTNGVFDLLHIGHLRLLERARGLGDVLVVAINSDDSTRRIKGPGRPVVLQFARAELLVRLRAVDFCFIFPENDPRKALRLVRPHVLAKGSDYSLRGVVGGRYVAGYGGDVVRIPLIQGFSTTSTIRRISGRRGARSRGQSDRA